MAHKSTARHVRASLFALLITLSLLVAPLAPLVVPTTSVAAAPGAATFGVPDLSGLGARVTTLYNNLLSAKPAAAQTTAPGGVTADLELWVKADVGTSTTTDGAAVTTWND